MVKRKQLGLIFSYDENWIGGTYYLLNIVNALNTLDDSSKPEITIISLKKSDYTYIQEETKYPYLKYHRHRSFVILDKVRALLPGVLFFLRSRKLKKSFDLLFPNPSYNYTSNEKIKGYWIPDFQEDYLLDLYSKDELLKRKMMQLEIAVKAERLVLSSNDAKTDFHRLYPFSKTSVSVIPFTVFHKNYSVIDLEFLIKKYKIRKDFYYCPNQFWVHKDHITVLKAVKQLKEKGIEIQVVFSGKESDFRQPELVPKLKDYVEKNNLRENIKFLGFIAKSEMLNLFNYATAIIQPSLFEGWSTVNEDAKYFNKYIIASDINVNKEQLQCNYSLFKAGDSNSLEETLKDFIESPKEIVKINYQENCEIFGKKFLDFI